MTYGNIRRSEAETCSHVVMFCRSVFSQQSCVRVYSRLLCAEYTYSQSVSHTQRQKSIEQRFCALMFEQQQSSSSSNSKSCFRKGKKRIRFLRFSAVHTSETKHTHTSSNNSRFNTCTQIYIWIALAWLSNLSIRLCRLCGNRLGKPMNKLYARTTHTNYFIFIFTLEE